MTVIPNVCGLISWPAAMLSLLMMLSLLIACVVLLTPHLSPRAKRLLVGVLVAVVIATGVLVAQVWAQPYNCCSPDPDLPWLCTVLWICLCPCPW